MAMLLSVLLLCAFLGLLAWLAWIDAHTYRLPDRLTFPLFALGWLWLIWSPLASHSVQDGLLGVALGGGGLWLLREGFYRWRGVDGLGLGDVKLFAALAVWVGWQGLPDVLLYASLGTLIFAGLLRLLQRLDTRQPLPFGPGLALAGALKMAFSIQAVWSAGGPF